MTFEDSSVETIFDIVVGLMHMRELELDARNNADESALLSSEAKENLSIV